MCDKGAALSVMYQDNLSPVPSTRKVRLSLLAFSHDIWPFSMSARITIITPHALRRSFSKGLVRGRL